MTVWMFPGQGSQTRGMGKELFDQFADLTRSASDILGYSISELCLTDPRKELNDTRFTQPALYTVNALSWRQRQAATGGTPSFLMGHSLGEYNALEAAGAFSFEDGLRMVQKRGALMAEAPPGAMAAVLGLTEENLREALAVHSLDSIDIANLNAPTQVILSGLKDDIGRALTALESDTVRCIPLNTSGAFHSRYMVDARGAFEDFLAGIEFNDIGTPVISNVYAELYPADIASALSAQITQTVQWTKSLLFARARGETEFEELGPGQVLTRLAEENRKSAPTVALVSEPEAETAPQPSTDTKPASDNNAPYDRDRELLALQEQIDDWNRKHPVKTRVRVKGYDSPLVTRTRAMTLFGHRAAIYVEGHNGYFELSDVQPV